MKYKQEKVKLKQHNESEKTLNRFFLLLLFWL